jgi:hypothetical protein
MSEKQKLSGKVGDVLVGTLRVTIGPLSQAEETTLDKLLRKAAEAEAGDHYTRVKPMLAAAKDYPADRLEIIREATRNGVAKAKLGQAAFWEYRTSPAGTATELYHRGRKYTEELKEDALAAVITEANVDEVSEQLFAILNPDGDEDPKAATP